MKMSRIFWGVLFVTAGSFLLLFKFGVLNVETGTFLKFWPLLIVVWGIGVLAGSRGVKIASVVGAALFLALGFYEGARWWWGGSEHGDITTQEFTQADDPRVASASLRFSSGAGRFMLTDSCAELLRAKTESNLGSYELITEDGKESRSFVMRLEGGGAHFRERRGGNTADIRLQVRPRWDLHFDIGAARLELDLRPFLVENLTINGGAGDVRVTLGDRAQECAVNIRAGVSSVRIRVPESSGCEIHAETPLSSASFEGLEKAGSGRYQSENFASAARKITMKISAGVSKIRVERY